MSAPDVTTPTKTCTKCGAEKDRASFSNHTRSRDGLQSWCKGCESTYRSLHHDRKIERDRIYRSSHRKEIANRNRSYEAANRESINERHRAWAAAHPEKARGYSRAYCSANIEKRAELLRKYRAANRDRIAEYNRAYHAAHLDLGAARQRNRYARERGNGGTHTSADVSAQYKCQHGHCYWCGAKVAWRKKHVDHVTPVILGGSNGPENLVIACPPCNQSKSGKHPMDFAGRLL